MGNPTPLPTFLRPMLAQPGRAFDSDQHLFEIKWDGIRALAFVEHAGYRLVSRHGLALDGLFPELAGDLPPGTLLDGELVVLRNGRPDLSLVQSRQQLRRGHKIRVRAQTTPATYLVFDQLYHEYRPLLGTTLSVRRKILLTTLGRAGHPRLVFSQGVLGAGRAFFQQVSLRSFADNQRPEDSQPQVGPQIKSIRTGFGPNGSGTSESLEITETWLDVCAESR